MSKKGVESPFKDVAKEIREKYGEIKPVQKEEDCEGEKVTAKKPKKRT